MNSQCAAISRRGPYSPESVAAAAAELRAATGGSAPLAMAFVTSDYLPHIEEFCEIVRVDGHVIDIVGCTGAGLTSGATEAENEAGFSLLTLGGKDARFTVSELGQHLIEQSSGGDFWRRRAGVETPSAWIVLLNPFTFDTEAWLPDWNASFPAIPCVGGLASGEGGEETAGVFFNGRPLDGVAVAVEGLRVLPVISQGCRPIGEPLTVTKAESNVVYSLGAQPAYEALESAFEGLSDGEKATAKGNLFAGLAGTEYVEDFKPGDFVIRNILGADPNSGAVVIGGFPRIGQTLQYQLRDKSSADSEWRAVLRHAAAESGRPPLGSLLFSCAGRGAELFGGQSHDARLLEEILGAHPSAGFFGNGEVAPLGGRNYLHSFTAAAALFFEKEGGE